MAGKFYPASKDALTRELRRCFDGIFIADDPSIVGVISPHAGYMYSGKVAAHAYAVIPHADTYVILCPNHTGYGSGVSISTEVWSTPLGEVGVDTEFIDAMPGYITTIDELAHRYEHSLEVQLPFLQYRFKDDFEIVPICMGFQDHETAKEVGAEIREAANATGRKIVVIASSDFSHYVPLNVAQSVDNYLIDALIEVDVDMFYARIAEKSASLCGYGPIAAMLYATQPTSGKLLNYATSGEVTHDSHVVGYVAMGFKNI